jgi:glycosyltransferase involved in cell wall biosynthesis
MKINLDTTYVIGKNGISRDAESILKSLRKFSDISEVRFLGMSLNKNRLLRRLLNIFNLLTGFHIPISKKHAGILYQPHLSFFKPGKKSSGWVIRLHDLFPITNPEWFRIWAVIIFRRNLNFAVSNGAHFLFSSEYSKNIFLGIYPDCKNLVSVYPCDTTNLDEQMCHKCDGCSEIQSASDLRSTILAVGTIEPRKNYDFLINFWNEYGNNLPSLDRLIVVGSPGWKSKKTQLQLSRLTDNGLTWIKYACDGSLNFLYNNSKCFLSASLNEGYNLPALEARRNYGLPLFLSDVPVHREVHGHLANYFDGSLDLYISLSREIKEKSFGLIHSNSPDSLILQDFFLKSFKES